MGEGERRGVGGRVRDAYRFWSTDERFSWGARQQFIVMGPFCAAAAILCAVVQAWAPAIVFGIGAAYMGNWLLRNRRRNG